MKDFSTWQVTLNNPFYFSTSTDDDIEKEIENIDIDSPVNKFVFDDYLTDVDFLHYLNAYNNVDEFKQYCEKIKDLRYFIFQVEKGSNKETVHIHLMLDFPPKKRKTFNFIKNLFPLAHIEEKKGTKEELRDYCSKEDTRLCGPYSWGKWVSQGQREDISKIVDLVKEGFSNYQLIEEGFKSQVLLNSNKIDNIRQIFLEEKFKKEFRNLEVTYIWGSPGSGKSRYVMETYGFENVYRITNYGKNMFDGYNGQDVIVFEEFRSQPSIVEMLNFLDGYPLMLPCRFKDKVACYTKVYIISNIPFESQYKSYQYGEKTTFKALARRISKIINFDDFLHKQLHFFSEIQTPTHEYPSYLKAYKEKLDKEKEEKFKIVLRDDNELPF